MSTYIIVTFNGEKSSRETRTNRNDVPREIFEIPYCCAVKERVRRPQRWRKENGKRTKLRLVSNSTLLRRFALKFRVTQRITSLCDVRVVYYQVWVRPKHFRSFAWRVGCSENAFSELTRTKTELRSTAKRDLTRVVHCRTAITSVNLIVFRRIKWKDRATSGGPGSGSVTNAESMEPNETETNIVWYSPFHAAPWNRVNKQNINSRLRPIACKNQT
jgi:hypothetical protein